MEVKQSVVCRLYKERIPLDKSVEGYLVIFHTEAKSAKTLHGYKEKLRRFCRWLNGNLAVPSG